MMGKHAGMRSGTGQGRGIWPVLAMLLAAVLVPAACVLWFMNAAMRNERLAVRQKLTEVYRQKVQTDQNEIAACWSSRSALRGAAADPAEDFARLVGSGRCSSAIVLDAAGRPAYPQEPLAEPLSPATSAPGWDAASDWENTQRDDVQAAEAYGQCAAEANRAGDAVTRIRASRPRPGAWLRRPNGAGGGHPGRVVRGAGPEHGPSRWRAGRSFRMLNCGRCS